VRTIVAIFGKSGSGKDTLISEFSKKYKLNIIKRLTSRPMRPHETQGNPYIFKDEVDLSSDIVDNVEDYLEVGIFNDFIYATKSESIKEGLNIGSFDLDAIEQLCYNDIKDIFLLPIYLECPDKVRIYRQIERGDEIKEVARRFLDDDKKYSRFYNKEIFLNYHIINSENEVPLQELVKILKLNKIKLEEY
jgi:guanylate kinase